MIDFSKETMDLVSTFYARESDILKVQVSQDDTVLVEGTLVNDDFNSLNGIKDSNFAIVNPITQKGIYTFDINGLEKIKVTKEKEDTILTIVGVS